MNAHTASKWGKHALVGFEDKARLMINQSWWRQSRWQTTRERHHGSHYNLKSSSHGLTLKNKMQTKRFFIRPSRIWQCFGLEAKEVGKGWSVKDNWMRLTYRLIICTAYIGSKVYTTRNVCLSVDRLIERCLLFFFSWMDPTLTKFLEKRKRRNPIRLTNLISEQLLHSFLFQLIL